MAYTRKMLGAIEAADAGNWRPGDRLKHERWKRLREVVRIDRGGKSVTLRYVDPPRCDAEVRSVPAGVVVAQRAGVAA